MSFSCIAMNDILKNLVSISALALEAEDRYILGAVTANKAAYSGESGGILRINNERYYQFIVARALMSSMPYRVQIEVDTHDLVLEEPETGERIAVIEMKRWMSPTGQPEIRGIVHDMREKLPNSAGKSKIMLIFSANPIGSMRDQLEWLSTRLDIDAKEWVSHAFPTVSKCGESVEYWVAGYQVG